MRSEWLSSWLGTWPKDLPRLYPQLDDRLLSCFLSDAEYRAILKMPIAAVLPLYSVDSSDRDKAFGAALARLLTRDLMLLESVSFHGPEDAPTLAFEEAAEQYPRQPRRVTWISGIAHIEEGLCKVDFRIFAPGKPVQQTEVRGSMFKEFVAECALAISEALGVTIPESLGEKWSVGRPANVVNLLRFGKILTSELPAKERSYQAKQLWTEDMDFSIVLQALVEQEANYRVMLLEGYRRDPYNVALLCQLFNAVRETNGHEPYAVQFARKALELSPGCGRAHLYMPEAAHPEASLLRHSELAHYLLPGNMDAVLSYLAAMCRASRSPRELTELVREAINRNPYDPENYHRVIEVFVAMKQPRYALHVAKGLQQLFEPEMHPRTRQCLEQDPRRRHLLQAGDYDPAREVRLLMRRLRESITGAGALGS